MPNHPSSSKPPGGGRRQTQPDLRHGKPSRQAFMSQPRQPITVVLDRIRHNYNIGAIFRLCDAFLVERLIIAGVPANLRKRKLVQAAQGAQYWVPWTHAIDPAAAVARGQGDRRHRHRRGATALPRKTWSPRLPFAWCSVRRTTASTKPSLTWQTSQ
jgi:hypothetical protein